MEVYLPLTACVSRPGSLTESGLWYLGYFPFQIGDFRVMKDVAEITRLPPARRLSSVQELIKTLNSSPAAAAKLAEWGLEICPGKLPRCFFQSGLPIFGTITKEVHFQQTHNQGLLQLFLTVSWDLPA